MKINKNFDNLVPNYLFADVAKKTAEFAKANPDKKIGKGFLSSFSSFETNLKEVVRR